MLDEQWFDRVEITNENFSGRPHSTWGATESIFIGCAFEDLRVSDFTFGAGRKMSEYRGCSFDRSTIRSLVPGRVRFVDCSFRDVTLTKWICSKVEFVDCAFSGKLSEINFIGNLDEKTSRDLGRLRNAYHGNDFGDAQFADVAFKRGIDLLDQRLPQEPGYLLVTDGRQVLGTVLEEVAAWPASRERTHALIDLDLHLEKVAAERQQEHVLFSPYDWVSRDGTRERAFERLSEVLMRHGAVPPPRA